MLYLKIKKVDPSFTKEFSLIGENNKVEKVRVKENVSLFNKNLKVNKITYVFLRRRKNTDKSQTETKRLIFIDLLKYSCQSVANLDARKSHWRRKRKNWYFSKH